METIQEIPISEIKLNPLNPRKEFEKESLQELSNSIESIGLINPIQVKKIEGGYELICGERRFKAHKLANKKTIKAIVKEYNSKDDELVESLVENLHRADLNSEERENFITKLWESGKYKTKIDLGKVIGVKQDQIKTILSAKILREQLNPTKNISTRDLRDIDLAKNFQDKKNMLIKLENGKIYSSKLASVSKVINHSPNDVKKAYFSDKISIEQAEKISKIDNEKIRSKMIQAHKEIKNIDKGIEKNFEKSMPKNKNETVKIKELIQTFRQYAIENQKATQLTIKSLIKTIPMVNLMDEAQLKQLSRFQELFETNISNALELSINLKEKIEQ